MFKTSRGFYSLVLHFLGNTFAATPNNKHEIHKAYGQQYLPNFDLCAVCLFCDLITNFSEGKSCVVKSNRGKLFIVT